MTDENNCEGDSWVPLVSSSLSPLNFPSLNLITLL